MGRAASLCLSILVLSAGVLLLNLNGCGGGGSTGSITASGKIQHVVIIFQENRTPDNLFHDPVLISRGADIQNYGMNSLGQKITLTPIALQTDFDLSHSHQAFLDMYDNGKMDGADKLLVSCNPNPPDPCPPPNAWFQYVQSSDVAPYLQLAETYTFADRMFQTNEGPSFPAHQFMLSGTSAPSVGSDLFASENPLFGPDPFNSAGCIAAPQETVNLITPSGDESQT